MCVVAVVVNFDVVGVEVEVVSKEFELVKVKLIASGLIFGDEVVAMFASVCVFRSCIWAFFTLDSVLVDEDVDALVRKLFELRMDLVNGVQRVASGNSGVDAYLKGLCVSSTFWVWCVISVFVLVDSDNGIGS